MMNQVVNGLSTRSEAVLPAAVLRGASRPDLIRDEVLAEIFAASAAARPGHQVMICGSTRLSYGEVDAISDRIASGLVAEGIGPGDVVGLWMARGTELLIAQIAIAKSGAAWLPFDADAPVERIATCLADAEAKVLVTSDALLQRAEGAGIPVWTSQTLGRGAGALVPARERGLTPDHPAYLIYTSGSTGMPKGIVISHRNICSFLRSGNALYGLTADDVMFQSASVAFDLSMEEIWIPYLAGATLFVATPEVLAEADRLPEVIEAAGVTAIDTVPTLLAMFPRDVASLRTIILGGEALPQSIAQRWAKPGRRIFNTYGPTEATVVATAWEVNADEPVTIGGPVANYSCYVVGDDLALLPTGEQGELLIGGPGVAQGYLKRPELTGEKFIPNPFLSDGSDPVLYRSGDAVSIDARGQIVFHGRIDDQVKIRGFRVELGEIEAKLDELDGVHQAAVVLRQDDGIDRLVAFIVTEPGSDMDRMQMRVALGERLPSYMVPSRFELLAELPRLISGKIDRKALKALPLAAPASAEAQEEPRTPTEAALLKAAQGVFPGQVLPFDADFFADLGGHSLLAARFISTVRHTPGLAGMNLQDVYQARTLRAMAARLDGRAFSAAPERDLAFTPPPLMRRFWCGLAQAAAMPFIMGLVTIQWLGLFLASMFLIQDDQSFLSGMPTLLGVYVGLNIGAKLLTIALKWLILGRTRPGRYPLWGAYYFRVWLVQRLIQTTTVKFLQCSPLMRAYLRAMGARIGKDAIISEFEAGCMDLISIGDNASLGSKVKLANMVVIGNEMVIGTITVGADAVVGSSCVLGADCVIGEGTEVADLSNVQPGAVLEAWTRYDGSPLETAGLVDRAALPAHPETTALNRAAQGAVYVAGYVVIQMLGLVPIFPAFYVLYNLDTLLDGVADYSVSWVDLPFLALPTAMFLIVVSALLMVAIRWAVLPTRMKPGTYSIHSWFYVRKWLVGLATEVTLETVSSLYATIFMRGWYRMMGAKIGKGSEISTNLAGRYDLIDIGADNFCGDEVVLGDEEIARGWMKLEPVKTGDRVFVGNSAVVAPGAVIEEGALIGVKSKLPDSLHVGRDEIWFGSPAIKFPNRQKVAVEGQWTYAPSRWKLLMRGIFESLHTSLPTAVFIVCGYMTADLIEGPISDGNWLAAVGVFLASGLVIGAVLMLLVAVVKWVMMGVYKPTMRPMWSFWAMRTEAVAVLYGGLVGKASIEFLRGTPFLPWVLRLYGTKMGKGVWMDLTDVTEFDCVEVGDYCTLNLAACLQTHLYEDRVMKVGRVKLGKGVHVGWGSTVLYDTHIGDFAQIGPMTLVMKGETLPGNTEWLGAPAVPAPAPFRAEPTTELRPAA
jgi:non-ribosomal peptide synthetase-like protein